MLPQQAVDLRHTGPVPLRATDDDADSDARPTNPYGIDPTEEYAAGYFRRTQPPVLEPADEDTEILVVPHHGEASARVVFSSVFLLSALGLGAFLLMYSSVHTGELHAAQVAPESHAAAPAESQTATIGTVAPHSGGAPLAPAPDPAATLAPLPTVLLAEPPATVLPSAAPTQTTIALTQPPPAAPAQTAVAPAQPAPVDAVEANPYEDKPSAIARNPTLVAPAKTPVVIHIEPNPVKNPYEGSAEKKAPSAE